MAEVDLLDIKNDVKALATLIAARDIAPPLSIGIFGEGGSGKSFFIQQLVREVESITQAARNSGQPEQEIYFYKHIIQIEVSRWNYLEEDLRNGLIQHIVSNLPLARSSTNEKESFSTKLQKEFLNKLKIQSFANQKAFAHEQEAIEELEQAQAGEEEAERQYNAVAKNLEEFKGQNILTTVFANPELQDKIEGLLKAIGLPEPKDDQPESFMDAFDQIETLLDHGLSFLGPLFYGTQDERHKSWIWLTIFLCAIPVSGILVGLVTGMVSPQWLAQTTAVIVSATTSIATGIAWLARRAKWIHSKLVAMEKTRQSKDFLMAQEQDRVRTQVEATEKELELKKGRYSIAQHSKTAAQQRLAQIEAEKTQTNRIVLYFDDLDLCPPDVAMDIFKVIHQLQSFQLFVVVVAVNVEWIGGLLQSYYGKLPQVRRGLIKISTIRNKTIFPINYLEKIFQIPFWLNPPFPKDRLRMVHGLLQPDLEEDVPVNPVRAESPEKAVNANGKTDLTPTRLVIQKEELKFMGELEPLLAGSPRALKRFTNLYRLVKLSQPEALIENIQLPMFLLALMTNLPAVSIEFFRALQTVGYLAKDKGGEVVPGGWEAVCHWIEEGQKLEGNRDWERLKRWLLSKQSEPPLTADLDKLVWWIPRVGRYSFFEELFRLSQSEQSLA